MMALSGDNASLAMTLKQRQRLAAPCDVPRYAQHLPVDMTIVCIDILEKNLIESRKPNGRPPFRRT